MRFTLCLFSLLCRSVAASGLQEVELGPQRDLHIAVGIGEAQFYRFKCFTPADVVVTLNSFSDAADPLLFISVDPNTLPSFGGHESSTFSHWLEDKEGVHYATAKGVGPKGGILGLMNVRNFAAEELRATLSLRCSYLVAFDTLFWDHLHSTAVCPSSPQHQACSGRGQCSVHGECECDSLHTGPACEHRKLDILHNDHFRFQVESGHYQYFRVHIPPRFPGGYVEVEVESDAPVVLLIRYDDLPSKSLYDLSNFDDWINRRTVSRLKFKVEPNQNPNSGHQAGPRAFKGPESLGLAGRAPAISDGMPSELGITSNMQQALEGEMPGSLSMGPPPNSRRLNANASDRRLNDQCPQLGPQLLHPACTHPDYIHCEETCNSCLKCVEQHGGAPGAACGGCQECITPKCTRALAACAADKSCSGPEAQRCETGCGSCLSCLESPDGRCGLCHCCAGCLPLAAKCMHDGASETRYVFVGILHHRRYKGERPKISASASVKLVEDQEFLLSPPQRTWTAELYDQFLDLRNVEITNAKEYPPDEQFLYNMEIRQEALAKLQVRTFQDRMTLIHLQNVHEMQYMQMDFLAGPKISHVLVSSKAAPKTLFDFDQVFTKVDSMVNIHANDKQNVWCAIFGSEDGYATITVKSSGEAANYVQNLLLLLLAVALCFLCGGCGPVQEKLSTWLRAQGGRSHESTTSLTVDPLQGPGYSGSDVIDRTVEDQYLHRGGWGHCFR